MKNKVFKITSNPKYDGYQIGLASMKKRFLIKTSASPYKSSESGIVNQPNYQLENAS